MAIFPSHVDLEELNARFVPLLEKSAHFQITAIEADCIKAEFEVTAAVTQPFGILHGGFSCVVAEGLGSVAGHLVVNDPKKTVVGQSLNASHIRPGRLGTRMEAVARPVHLGGRSQIWDIMIQEKTTQKLICKVSLTLALIQHSQG